MTNKRIYEPLSAELEAIGKKIVDALYTVHKNLGPGLLEKVYEICFCHELKKRGLNYESTPKSNFEPHRHIES